MRKALIALLVSLWPLSAMADEKSNNEFAAEAGVDFFNGNFSSDREAELIVRRYQPFLRFEYGLGRWIFAYTTIATEATEMAYTQRVNDEYRIRMNMSSGANVFLAHGLKINVIQYGRFRLQGLIQYEFALWDLTGDINSAVVTQGTDELKITRETREHVSAEYNWRRLHFALLAEYQIWRFTPYAMFGWSILDANLTFHYDSDARAALALFGYETGSEDRDHYRAGAPIGMVGTEFRIWRGLSAHLAGAAVPDKDGWVFAGRASLLFRP
ncbi:hypothetical protein HYT45_02470 [Candidatus Uhrbacteria bacterium]|nr:hypothetical protein [Candidatus Uhrbacteria bacterium]